MVPSYATVSIQSVAHDLKPGFILIIATQVTKRRIVNDTLNFIGCMYVQELISATKWRIGALRRVHTMKVMLIGGELIRIVCVHTECALTAIRIECAFGQSTFIGGLKPV